LQLLLGGAASMKWIIARHTPMTGTDG